MTELDTNQVLTMKIEEAYNTYTTLLDEEITETETLIEIKKYYKKIRFGINLEFDLYDIFTENYTEKPKTNKIVINSTRKRNNKKRK